MSPLSPKGEELIRAARRAYRPSDADCERVFARLRTRLGDAVAPENAGATPSAAAAASSSSSWPLLSVLALAVGLVGGAVFYAWSRGGDQGESRQVVAPADAVAEAGQPPAPPSEPPALPPTAPPVVGPTVPPASPAAASSSRTANDRLAAEVALLSRATRELRAGRPADALKALDEHRRKFPKALLAEQQRSARAQALCALGRFAEANATLVELPPKSPLAVSARQFCDASRAGL